jgi:hypothetical protein
MVIQVYEYLKSEVYWLVHFTKVNFIVRELYFQNKAEYKNKQTSVEQIGYSSVIQHVLTVTKPEDQSLASKTTRTRRTQGNQLKGACRSNGCLGRGLGTICISSFLISEFEQVPPPHIFYGSKMDHLTEK